MVASTETVTVEKLVERGWGLAHRETEVVLLRGVIPGEQVAIADETQHKGYREARVGGIVHPSPDRVAAPCPVYGVCGGCQLQHIRYETQLALKQAVLKETLHRVGKLMVEDIPLPLVSPQPYGYRSTVRFVVFKYEDTFRLGFHEERSLQPVAAAGCLLVPADLQESVAAVNARLTQEARLPVRVHSIEFRRSAATREVLLIHRTGPGSPAKAHRLMACFQDAPAVVGQVMVATEGRRKQRWVSGQDWIGERLSGLGFRISERSFMQANWVVNQMLSDTVADWAGARPGLRILELYAGIGTLGLPLARRGAHVTLVEANPHASRDARHAAKTNHVGRCRFRCTPAEAMLATVRGDEYDLVILDPPRTGVSESCVARLLALGVPRVLYLSCDAATLARDLARLCAGGYRLVRLQPFDMFPQTAHVETLVELVR